MAEKKAEIPVALPMTPMPRMGRRNAITPSQEDVEAITTSYPVQEAIFGTNQKFVLVETSQPNSYQGAPVKAKQRVPRVPQLFDDFKIPWKNQDMNQSIATERKKMFDSFKKTSIEPPETPDVSESKLRRMMSKVKRKKRKDSTNPNPQPHSDSEESLDLPNVGPKLRGKPVYTNIRPKVNTRWNKYDELNKWKQQQREEAQALAAKQAAKVIAPVPAKQSKKASKTTSRSKATTLVKKPGPVVKARVPPSTAKTETTTTLMKPKPLSTNPNATDSRNGKVERVKKLVTNYPASETVKNTTARLPLTIGPRFNPKKAMGMAIAHNTARAELVGDTTTRLYGSLPPIQKLKYEAQQQHQHQHQHGAQVATGLVGPSIKSTFFNLHRINQGGIMNMKQLDDPIGQLVVVRHPRPGGVGHIITVETKKAGPPLTTIQAPPSPFMTSNISIPNQLNEITVNGDLPPMMPEKSVTNSNKTDKSSSKSKSKRSNATGNNNYGGSNKSPQTLRKSPLPNRSANSKRDNPPKLTGKPAKTASPSPPPQANKIPVHVPTVVPTLGPAPNKYNNIYIGPYSGSESEGEMQNPKKRR